MAPEVLRHAAELLAGVLAVACTALAFHLCLFFRLRPQSVLRQLRRQGVSGPPPSSFLAGNMPEVMAMLKQRSSPAPGSEATHAVDVVPHLDAWRKDYGPEFVFLMGSSPVMHVASPEIVKDITLCVSPDLGRSTFLRATLMPLFGDGILKSNGESWARQRKVIAPEFFINRVKDFVDIMVASANPLLKSWEEKVDGSVGKNEVDMEVYEDLRNYSADVISRTCFDGGYLEGKEIFVRIRELEKICSKPDLVAEIAGFRVFPTRSNRDAWKLEREVRSLIMEVMDSAERNSGVEENLLRVLLRSAGGAWRSAGEAEKFVVDNCKAIYFAGHETTAVASAWCLLLLALNPEWQEIVREEVKEACSGGWPPDAAALGKMKKLTMVLQETLRLYPPGPLISRQALKAMKLGGVDMPEGLSIYIPVSALHRDPDAWGPDAGEFNPERFAGGVSAACRHPQMYMPFGAGTRTCLGQHFAMSELKVVVSAAVSRFAFSPSPTYRHSPSLQIALEPEHGVHLIVKKVGG